MRYVACLVFLLLSADAAVAKECRTPNVPQGVRVQLPAGCRDPIRTGAARNSEQEYLRSDQGFVDLGGGTKIRIGGRVRLDSAIRR